MRRENLAIGSATLFITVAAALGGEAKDARPKEDGKDSEKAVKWLKKLEKRGRSIESFQAKITYEKFKPLVGDRQTRLGHVAYVAGPPPKFLVVFNRFIVGQTLRERKKTYIFDGRWLVEKDHKRKLFIKREVVPKGEELDPLAIGEGPFPVPLGQETEKVQSMFQAKILPPGKDAPPKSLHMRLVPRPDIPESSAAAEFRRVDVWYHRETLLPQRVRTVDQKKARTTVTLSKRRVNELDPKEAEERFSTEPPEGWRVETNARKN